MRFHSSFGLSQRVLEPSVESVGDLPDLSDVSLRAAMVVPLGRKRDADRMLSHNMYVLVCARPEQPRRLWFLIRHTSMKAAASDCQAPDAVHGTAFRCARNAVVAKCGGRSLQVAT